MPQRIRCRFELYSSEVSGLPADVGAVRLLVEHNKVSKKYDYTDTLLASHGTTTQLEDLAGSQPLLAFTCHVYPSKAVTLRLMGSTSASRDRPSLKRSRGNHTWTQLATATLPLDQLAQQLLLPGIAAPEPPRTSTELSARPQVVAASTAAQPAEVLSKTSPPTSPFAAGGLPSAGQLLDAQDNMESDLFTTVPAAISAVAARRGGATAAAKTGTSPHVGSLDDLSDFESDLNNEDVRQAAQDAADVPPAAADDADAGGSAGAGYGAELQTSRLAVNWVASPEGVVLQQQLVVQAHLLGSRGSGWAQGIFGTNKASSIASSSRRTSTSATTASGSVLTHRKWTDKLYRSLKPNSGASEAGAAVPRSVTSPHLRDDDNLNTSAGGGVRSAPASPADNRQGQAPAAANMGVQVAGRLPSFEPWATTITAEPAPDTTHLPAGHPLNFLATRGPTAAPQQITLAKRSTEDHTPAAGSNTPQQQPEATAAGGEADDDQAVKHEFLQLILATLSSSHSVESEAALPPPSAAQLAAAASLPRAPSAADLAAFAVAAGLPIEKVAEAAATKLGAGSAPTSVAASGGSSGGTSARASPRKETQDETQEKSLDPVNRLAAAPAAAPAPTPAPAPASAVSAAAAAAAGEPDFASTATPGDASAAVAAAPLDSLAAGASPAAALAAAVSEAAAAAIAGEAVTVVVESLETAAVGPAGEEVHVPVTTIAEAAPMHSSSAGGVPAAVTEAAVTEAAADKDSKEPRAMGAAADASIVEEAHVEGSEGPVAAEPSAVVTATTMAVLHDSSSSAATPQEAGSQGWEPQQLSVATTTITATPVHAQPADEQLHMPGTADAGIGSTDVVVVSTTDVAITHVSDAELADFAAPVPVALTMAAAAVPSYFESDGPGGLPGPAAAAPLHPVYRGDSLGLGAVGEGGAMQLHAVSRSTSAAVEDLSRATTAADESAAYAAAWAAEHGIAEPVIAPAAAGLSAAAVGAMMPDLHAAGAPLSTVRESQDQQEAAVTEASAAAPVAHGVVGSAALLHGDPAGLASPDVERSFATPDQCSPAGPAVEADQVEQEQLMQQSINPSTSEEALELQVVSPGPGDATATATASTGIQISDIRSAETAAAAAKAPPAIQELITSHPAASAGQVSDDAAAAAAAAVHPGPYVSAKQHNPQQQRVSSAHLRLNHEGGHQLQPTSSGTSRLAEVLDRINSQPFTQTTAASPADTWPTLNAASGGLNSQDLGTHGSSTGLSSSTLLTTAGSMALALPQLLLSTTLAAARIAGKNARARLTARSNSSGAQSSVWTDASSAAYWGSKRAAAAAIDLGLFIPRSIALGLFSVWLLVVTQLFVRPWLALISRIMPAVSRRPAAPGTGASAEAGTTAAKENDSSSSSPSDQEVDAAAARLLSGISGSGSWLWRVTERVSRSPSSSSSASSYVPPTPAPSLEVGQSSDGVIDRSWSSMMGLLLPALSRSPSISSGPLTPPPTPAITPAQSMTAAVPQLDLAPANLTVAAPSAGLSSSRSRKSRLGMPCTGGLSTIASVTDLVAAAEAAEAAEAAAGREAAHTQEEAAVEGEPSTLAAADGASSSSWWWGLGYGSAAAGTTNDEAVDDNRGGSWWSDWKSNSAANRQDAAPVASLVWLPGWLLFTAPSRNSTGPEVAAVVADDGEPILAETSASVPVEGVVERTTESAAAVHPRQERSWLGFMSREVGATVQQLAQIMLAPVLWYVDAVSSVLRSGVHTATWLVELAVWWALLPGRLAWWGVSLPFRASAAVVAVIMHSNSRGAVHREDVAGPSAG